VVGYSVRLDSKTSQRTRLLFCTTGVLLRRLLSEPDLGSVSHIVIDEVHERSVDIDLLLLLLRDLAASPRGRELKVGELLLCTVTKDTSTALMYCD
jgi:ATP-dependent RNA helicase DHX57